MVDFNNENSFYSIEGIKEFYDEYVVEKESKYSTAGIFLITHLPTNQKYLGAVKDIWDELKRIKSDIDTFKKGILPTHLTSLTLAEDFDKDGSSKFKFQYILLDLNENYDVENYRLNPMGGNKFQDMEFYNYAFDRLIPIYNANCINKGLVQISKKFLQSINKMHNDGVTEQEIGNILGKDVRRVSDVLQLTGVGRQNLLGRRKTKTYKEVYGLDYSSPTILRDIYEKYLSEKSLEPTDLELGDLMFNSNKTQRFKCPEYVVALLREIDRKLEIVYLNENHNEYSSPFNNTGEEFKCPIFEVKSYNWDDTKSQEYNFKWKDKDTGSTVHISWYKYLGRDTTINGDYSYDTMIKMFDECIDYLIKRQNKD